MSINTLETRPYMLLEQMQKYIKAQPETAFSDFETALAIALDFEKGFPAGIKYLLHYKHSVVWLFEVNGLFYFSTQLDLKGWVYCKFEQGELKPVTFIAKELYIFKKKRHDRPATHKI